VIRSFQGKFYSELILISGEKMSGEAEKMQRDVLEKCTEKFPSEYLDVVRHADLSSLSWAPLMFRPPWGIIFGKLSKGNVTVAGDAMHPMTPDLGNGGGASLEDAVVLGRHIGNSFINNGGLIVPGDMAKAIVDYVKERRWRAAMVVTASYLSGRMQQGDKWWIKFLRDRALYKYFFGWLSRLVFVYDCGRLPAISFGAMDLSSKKD
jgi:2-polyprenyl-6-methoxyphenol hydroxylase-like FAD-dependent oxidoreductase